MSDTNGSGVPFVPKIALNEVLINTVGDIYTNTAGDILYTIGDISRVYIYTAGDITLHRCPASAY